MKWAKAWHSQGTACFKKGDSMRSSEKLGKGQICGYNCSDKPFEGLSGRKCDLYIFLKVTLAVLWRQDWGKQEETQQSHLGCYQDTQDDDLHLP